MIRAPWFLLQMSDKSLAEVKECHGSSIERGSQSSWSKSGTVLVRTPELPHDASMFALFHYETALYSLIVCSTTKRGSSSEHPSQK